ncbi:MAG: hypothetical protein IPJ66_05790 [Bacteroidetes bacterium]|nr:hypothetical protein [Bacteroidota bacterium]
MKVFIEQDDLFSKEVEYIFGIFSRHFVQTVELCPQREAAELVISTDNNADIRISRNFFKSLREKKYHHSNYFVSDCLVRDPEGFVDYLSSAFYMLALVQEIEDTDLDEFGRFKYSNSYQYKFSNVTKDLVSDIFTELINRTPKLDKKPDSSSSFFLSHDMDTVHGSLLQDTFYNIKKVKPFALMNVLVSNMFQGPSWFNIDYIMKLESEYDFHSTFFWLVNKGKVNEYLNNSDYSIHDKRIRDGINRIRNSQKWENGIHKSASATNFEQELELLEQPIVGNRYHYLKYTPHQDFIKIEKAGILFDSSLGFADAMGFRNSYGVPYKPFNVSERKAYKFIECPLNVMDTTFYHYSKNSGKEFAKNVIDFIESHKTNCVMSILFHNNFYSNYKYKDYLIAIREVLKYLYEAKIKCVSQKEIINHYINEHPNSLIAGR